MTHKVVMIHSSMFVLVSGVWVFPNPSYQAWGWGVITGIHLQDLGRCSHWVNHELLCIEVSHVTSRTHCSRVVCLIGCDAITDYWGKICIDCQRFAKIADSGYLLIAVITWIFCLFVLVCKYLLSWAWQNIKKIQHTLEMVCLQSKSCASALQPTCFIMRNFYFEDKLSISGLCYTFHSFIAAQRVVSQCL